MSDEFVLNERLAKGCYEVGVFNACRILLKNEANFPWLILVPEVPAGVEELHQVSEERYMEIMIAVRKLSEFTEQYFEPEKLNVACIGNVVRQMHIHIVGRFVGDLAWPGVVWACTDKQIYDVTRASEIMDAMVAYLAKFPNYVYLSSEVEMSK